MTRTSYREMEEVQPIVVRLVIAYITKTGEKVQSGQHILTSNTQHIFILCWYSAVTNNSVWFAICVSHLRE